MPPYFKKAENWQGEASEPHGSGGFLTTSPMSERPAACRAIIAAARELGLEYRADVNHLPPGAGDSIGWCQQTRGGRRRASAARTYLKPATKRPNLQLITGALAHRVVFDGTRATGVEFSRDGGSASSIERADAACEVILAAGAVGSPHLLQLSGVGDPEVLTKAVIDASIMPRCPLDRQPAESLHRSSALSTSAGNLGRWQMARIRHIALVTDDPAKTAEFYKEHFGLTELYRRPGDTGEKGVWLSDGYIYFAILKYGEPGAPKLGPGQKSDLRGIHHIGFYVDDEQETAKRLRDANFEPVPIPKTERAETTPMGDAVNLKYLGPDEVQIDIRSRGWNEAISFGMQRYELTPVTEKEAAE